MVAININNNREHLFFQKPIIFGCRRGLFLVLANYTLKLFLICYNKLNLRVEIIMPSCLNDNGNLQFSRMAYDLREENFFFLRPLLHRQIK